MPLNYIKSQTIDIKSHPELSEKWVQGIIAKDPSIIGLGELILKDKERRQSSGRLDLLLQDEDERRFEVEIQLGKTDESHIIRTIEYWDNEKMQDPDHEHIAVIIAEDITSRFLNVISLFNKNIPLIAIKMNAIKIGKNISLVFTKVLDQAKRKSVDTPRSYWEQKVTKQTLEIADEIMSVIKTLSPNYEFNYRKHYIGLMNDKQVDNFVRILPKKNNFVILRLKLQKSNDIDEKIKKAGLGILDYDYKWKRYKIRIKKDDIENQKKIIKDLIKLSYNYSR
jgi:hypothetical protein